MARFRFELEALLAKREREELDAQVAFAAAKRDRDAVARKVTALDATIADERDARRRAGQGGQTLEMREIRQQSAVIASLLAQRDAAARQERALAEVQEQRRAELSTRSSAKRAIELLRERRYEEWKRERDRAEARELDDLVVMRHAMRDST